MQFKLTINTDGDAFEVSGCEVARILNNLAIRIDGLRLSKNGGKETFTLIDSNGNVVGDATHA